MNKMDVESALQTYRQTCGSVALYKCPVELRLVKYVTIVKTCSRDFNVLQFTSN